MTKFADPPVSRGDPPSRDAAEAGAPRASRFLLWRASFFLTIMGLIRRMTIGVRVVMVDGDKVLLLRHTYIPGWHFPGGGVDPGETVDEAAMREVREETGYQPTGPLKPVGVYRNTIAPGRDHIAVYVCDRFEMAETFVANREIAEIGWFDRAALPSDTSIATRLRISEIFDGAPTRFLWRD